MADDHLDDLCVPSSLRALYDRFLALPSADRGRFTRGAARLAVAPDLWDSHIASYFQALVSAIEALANGTANTQHRFERFVRRYAGRTRGSSMADLYRVRSRIAHGGETFDIDDCPWLFMPNHPTALQRMEQVDRLAFLVSRIFVVWLSRKSSAERISE